MFVLFAGLLSKIVFFHVNYNFCIDSRLKVFLAADSDGRIISHNINRYLDHLKSHMVKTQIKKCNRCVLSFVHKGAMKVHLIYDHITMKHKKLRSMCKGSTKIPKPKVANLWTQNSAVQNLTVFFCSLKQLPIAKQFNI